MVLGDLLESKQCHCLLQAATDTSPESLPVKQASGKGFPGMAVKLSIYANSRANSIDAKVRLKWYP